MNRKQRAILFVGFIVAWVCWGSEASANLEQQKIFKGVFPGREKYSCTTCHGSKLPKKDAHELNDYGKKALDAAGGAGKKPTAEIYQQIGEPDASK